MKKIKLIFIRSKISSDPRQLEQQKEQYLSEIKKEFTLSEDGEVFFFIESGGTEEQFKEIYSSYKPPYNLIATNANNSLPASLEIASFLKNKNLAYNLYHATKEDILYVLKHNRAVNKGENLALNKPLKLLESKRYGVVGKPSNWLISSDVNYIDAKAKFGVTLIDITFDEFKDEIDHAREIIDPITFKSKLNKTIDQKTLEGALKIYSALYSIIKKHDLDGLTVRCFDLLGIYHNTSCLALAILNSQGYIATCEGDVPAMLSMAIIKERFHVSSFQVNPSYINEKEKYGYFAHCTIPLDMCIDYDFDTHFESGFGIGIAGKINLAKVTIFKVGSSLDKYEVFKGQIIENPRFKNLCRTQLKIKFSEDITSLLDLPCGNHLIIFKGDHEDEIKSLLSK